VANALITLSEFRVMFPEFQSVVDATINAALTDAADRVSKGVYKNQLGRAHGLMAADILVSSPWGASARLNAKTADGKTTYSAQLDKIRSERCAFYGIT
jgi:hypothetical protein